MKVKFFAYIRDYTGSKELDIDHYPTLYDLLLKLCKKYGKKFENKIFNKDGLLSSEIIILVNGVNIVHLQGLDTKLSPEDEISIFPVVAGG